MDFLFSVQQQPLNIQRPMLATLRPAETRQHFRGKFFQAAGARLQLFFSHASAGYQNYPRRSMYT